MKEFVPCKNCNNGYIFSKDRQSVKKCNCLKLYQEDCLLAIKKNKAGLEDFEYTLKEYRGKDEENNLAKISQYIEGLSKRYKNNSHLYFYGQNGTQKSTIAKCILVQAIKRSLSVKFVLMNDLMNTICNVRQEDEDKKNIQFLETCDILVVDDSFSAKKVTLYKNSKDYQMSFLDSFFRKRIEQNRKNTIFTSNVKIDDIEKNGFSYDIMNLLQREIQLKKGELLFTDVYIDEAHDVDIKSLWD